VPFTQANGQKLYYESHGEGDPLLLVMGLGTDHLAWALQLRDWTKRHRVIVFDNRDVGQSSYADGPYEIVDMAADALGLADALDLDSFHLLGMSLGGAIAQEMALAAPERVRTLTLVVTYTAAGRWGRERARLWGAAMTRTPREEHADTLLLLCLSHRMYDENPEFVGYVRRMMLENPHPQAPEAFLRQLEAGSRHDTRDRLGTLSMPVHVIGAEYDLMVPVWNTRELGELIPGARVTVLEGAPHAVNLEGAEEFNRQVLEFLEAARTPA
jgi:3-oxoadipate enol-lactonase